MSYKIKNWDKFQHYKNRCPPWVKLHSHILNDNKFMALADASKCLLMLLWILASENGGEVTDDQEELCFRLRKKKVDLKPLISSGFLVLQAAASTVLADAVPETEGETETEESEIGIEIYREFSHMSISANEVNKLMDLGMSLPDVDEYCDRIENFKGNKKYSSLYLTAMSWYKRDEKSKPPKEPSYTLPPEQHKALEEAAKGRPPGDNGFMQERISSLLGGSK